MVLKVEIDLEDLTQDLFNDEDYNLKQGVIDSIRGQVVSQIKTNCREQIESTIRCLVEQKMGVLIRETFLEWYKNGEIKVSGNENMKVQEYLEKRFTEQSKYSYDTTVSSHVKSEIEKFTKELKNRYDLSFAALVVKNLADQKLLADDKLAELVKK